MRRTSVLAIIVTAGTLLVPAVARAQGSTSSTAPETGIGMGLAEAPTSLRDDPRALVYVIDRVAPGQTITRKLRVSNGTDSPLTPKLYVAPASIANGSFTPGKRGTKGEIASWGSVSPRQLALARRSSAQAELRLSVPKNAPNGEYYGAALAEVDSGATTGVRLASRVGVRIYLSVGDGPAPKSDFEVTALEAIRQADGTPVVTAKVRNTGGRALDIGGELKLDEGPAGLSAGPFPVQVVTTLAIGTTAPVSVALDRKTPAGPWRARITLHSGTIVHTVGATITFPKPGAAARSVKVEEVQRQRHRASILAFILLGIVLLLLLAVLLRRRRQRDRRAEVPTVG